MPCDCDAAYEHVDDCPRCSAPLTVDDLFVPRAETPEEQTRRKRVLDALLTQHRDNEAFLVERDREREAAGDGPWFERRPSAGRLVGCSRPRSETDVQLAMPQIPDGPDDLLAEIAEMEAVVARERRSLDDHTGARRCRYCEEAIPRGPAPGVHPECLPPELPDGARSCTGCAELILDDEDEFEHDYCEAEYEELVDEDGNELFGTLAPEFGIEEIVWHPFGECDDDPTEPMLIPDPAPPPVRASDKVRCPCGRWNEVTFVAANDGHLARTVSMTSVECPCGTRINVGFSWSRRACVWVRFGEGDALMLTN